MLLLLGDKSVNRSQREVVERSSNSSQKLFFLSDKLEPLFPGQCHFRVNGIDPYKLM